MGEHHLLLLGGLEPLGPDLADTLPESPVDVAVDQSADVIRREQDPHAGAPAWAK